LSSSNYVASAKLAGAPNSQTQYTKIVQNDPNPVWNGAFNFYVSSLDSDKENIVLSAMDYDEKKPEKYGEKIVSLKSVADNGKAILRQWQSLGPGRGLINVDVVIHDLKPEDKVQLVNMTKPEPADPPGTSRKTPMDQPRIVVVKPKPAPISKPKAPPPPKGGPGAPPPPPGPPGAPPGPPGAPPPPGPGKGGKAPANPNVRNELLDALGGFTKGKLKKAVTIDKSKPVTTAEIEEDPNDKDNTPPPPKTKSIVTAAAKTTVKKT